MANEATFLMAVRNKKREREEGSDLLYPLQGYALIKPKVFQLSLHFIEDSHTSQYHHMERSGL